MACRSMLRSAILVQPFLHPPFNFSFNHYHIASHFKCNKLRTIRGRARQFNLPKPPLSCSYNETPPSHDDQDPPQQPVLEAISEVSKIEGSLSQPANMVIGGTVADDSTNEWLALDQKVNSYPTVRGFTAIGTGGDDFVQAMVVAVESVIQQPIPQGNVRQKLSSGGKYVSVNIGPIQVVSSEQVQAVYNAMRRDDRMKYFL
ncbi:uncharacterized protein LOC133284042 [Gastrolobium bilobum]|uniref:uncharacterized protein LOC133284042 n=1 Tax=Gastrolobium bilobum TaxID=150636 RepID=UPI002AAFBA6D|nr:uncharacterized protein LOC133284042 [Gastrolobium bilobum]